MSWGNVTSSEDVTRKRSCYSDTIVSVHRRRLTRLLLFSLVFRPKCGDDAETSRCRDIETPKAPRHTDRSNSEDFNPTPVKKYMRAHRWTDRSCSDSWS